MVTCWRRNAKSTLGRAGRFAHGPGLTGGGVGATVALAVVTTSSAGKSRLWPTAVSLVEAEAPPLAVQGSAWSMLEAGALLGTVGPGWSALTVGALPAGTWAVVAALAASFGVSQ